MELRPPVEGDLFQVAIRDSIADVGAGSVYCLLRFSLSSLSPYRVASWLCLSLAWGIGGIAIFIDILRIGVFQINESLAGDRGPLPSL